MHVSGDLPHPRNHLFKLSGEPWDIFRLALHLATEDSDVVTGQGFTIAGGLEGNYGQRCLSMFPPAAQCDAIDRILISLANDHPVSLVKSDLHQLFKFSQFQLGSLHRSATCVPRSFHRFDMIIIS
jgi:hypothetical protein